MNKHQITFILSVIILFTGIILDFLEFGLMSKIIIVVGALLSLLSSNNQKKHAITRATELENETGELEKTTTGLLSEIDELKKTIETVENINNISQKHLEEIQKFKSKEELSSKFISSICDDLQASKGAMFLQDGNKMVFSAGFAYSSENEEPLEFEVGEGLIGQVAKDNKSINIKDIPVDYIDINSGLGKAKPKNVIIQPIAYNGSVLGVFEIATFSELSDRDVNLLSLLSNNLATKLASF